jgi:FkbM family methyltransferase
MRLPAVAQSVSGAPNAEVSSVIDGFAQLDGKQTQALLNELRRDPARDDSFRAISFMMAMAPESKGQLFQDLWALWRSGLKRGGYFVEFGAASGVELSNTWLLEKRFGWNGILAEPNPIFFETLSANRDCEISTKCVYARTGERLEFLATAEPEYSRLLEIAAEDVHEAARQKRASTLSVETISLNDLLVSHHAPPTIDFLSIDTEGSELVILSAFDFDRWDVRAIAVEHNHTPARQDIRDLLASHGYRRDLGKISRHDDWYAKAD